jgi:predicted unusual protein kinase regulating ubiquinone biosynthesis (AarF/ABC1/UbiB family)
MFYTQSILFLYSHFCNLNACFLQFFISGILCFKYLAGNLLACPDGRLCYLDFGMMSYASKAQRNGFLLAVVHIVNRDWNELVRLYQRLGFIPAGTDLKPIEQGLEDALPDVLNADVSELNFKNVIGKLGDIMYTYVFRDDICMK